MKKLIIPFLAIVAFVALSACKTDVVERRDPSTQSTTTSTDQSTTRTPVDSSTTTTRTTQ